MTCPSQTNILSSYDLVSRCMRAFLCDNELIPYDKIRHYILNGGLMPLILPVAGNNSFTE